MYIYFLLLMFYTFFCHHFENITKGESEFMSPQKWRFLLSHVFHIRFLFKAKYVMSFPPHKYY